MSVKVACGIEIMRTPTEVAQYMFNPAHDLEWILGLTKSRALQPGPVEKGSRIARASKFLGREMDYTVNVVDCERDRLLEMRSDKPFPMVIRYELEQTAQGTLVHIRVNGEPKGFFKLAQGVLYDKVDEQIHKDLAMLKQQIEGLETLS